MFGGLVVEGGMVAICLLPACWVLFVVVEEVGVGLRCPALEGRQVCGARSVRSRVISGSWSSSLTRAVGWWVGLIVDRLTGLPTRGSLLLSVACSLSAACFVTVLRVWVIDGVRQAVIGLSLIA